MSTPPQDKRRRVLGLDALDGLVPTETQSPAEQREQREQREQEPVAYSTRAVAPLPPVRARRPVRSKITFSLPDELLEECRNAVDYLSGPPTRLTLATLVERALRKELAALRAKYTESETFPPRGAPLRTGRPMRG